MTTSILNRMTLAWVPMHRGRTAEAGGQTDEQPLPIYTNPRTFTLPLMVGMTTAAWAATKQLPGAYWHSVWFPFTVSMILGLALGLHNLVGLDSGKRLSKLEWLIGLVMATLNSLVVFGAVLGVVGNRAPVPPAPVPLMPSSQGASTPLETGLTPSE